MFTTVEIISMFAAIVGVLIGVSGWRRSDNKDAERLGIIENKLENILKSIERLIDKIDCTDEKFSEIEKKIAKLEEQVKTCFSMIKEEK